MESLCRTNWAAHFGESDGPRRTKMVLVEILTNIPIWFLDKPGPWCTAHLLQTDGSHCSHSNRLFVSADVSAFPLKMSPIINLTNTDSDIIIVYIVSLHLLHRTCTSFELLPMTSEMHLQSYRYHQYDGECFSTISIKFVQNDLPRCSEFESMSLRSIYLFRLPFILYCMTLRYLDVRASNKTLLLLFLSTQQGRI